MQKKQGQEWHKGLQERLTERTLLKKLQWSKKQMLSILKASDWTDLIQRIYETKRVDCTLLLNSCQEGLTLLAGDAPQEGWLFYTYGLLRKGLFETSVVLEETAEHNRGSWFYLEVLRFFLERSRLLRAYDPSCDFAFATEEEVAETPSADDYHVFSRCFREQYLYELMYIGREIMPFDTLTHIAGVHHVAMYTARQLKEAGVPVDLALISAAAAGHDIGKYGCREQEEKRIPYLHYYYTDLWFQEHGLSTIGHIAANHSTWDLELENLSVESLLLIYADFRIKTVGYVDGKEQIACYTLADSFRVILRKLDNVDQAKEERYRRVYGKLADFEQYMVQLGVDSTLQAAHIGDQIQKDAALLSMDETVEALKHMAISNNIAIMNRMGSEASFGAILEGARSEKDWKNIRSYIGILEEYFTYMSQKQKWMSLEFLYELLSHREGDIRRKAANLMGNIIVHYDEEYRKELPEGIRKAAEAQGGLQLWHHYLEMILEPDHKVTDQHRRWIGYALKIVVESVLGRCKEADQRAYVEPLLSYYWDWNRDDLAGFVLLHAMQLLPLELLEEQELDRLVTFAERMENRDSLEIRVSILRFLEKLSEMTTLRDHWTPFVRSMMVYRSEKQPISLRYLTAKIAINWKLDEMGEEIQKNLLTKNPSMVSEVFLENLKAATPWIVKSVNIAFLLDRVQVDPQTSLLHVATHLSNLLKVSERIAVRHRAGEALLQIAPLLTYDQRNEVAIELTKGLEIGEYQFSKYIPDYLGAFVLYLHPKELDELIKNLEELLISTNQRVVCVTLDTVGVMLEQFGLYTVRFEEEKELVRKRAKRLMGMLLSGLANYRESISQEALLVIGHRLFASTHLTLEEKNTAFRFLHKKLVTMMDQRQWSELGFFNSAATLNHLYRFISDYLFAHGTFRLKEPERVAFFPGTYDPFSLGHKGIASTIRDMGFLVYLALDEFSWSKKTQPRMIRRKIMDMSIANEQHIYLFPDDIPVNISNPWDLRRLRSLFPGKEVYMVAGSDVVENASAYRKIPEEDSIQTFPHILFRRTSMLNQNKECDMGAENPITAQVIELTLPVHLEDISSTRIRENIDWNRDISHLIDPIAQNYIYENNLYLREPQYKRILQKKSVQMEVKDRLSPEEEQELFYLAERLGKQGQLAACLKKRNGKCLVIRDYNRGGRMIGAATFRQVKTKELYSTFKSTATANYIREHTSGRIVHINGVFEGEYHESDYGRRFHQLLLSEVLAYCLAKDYTYAVYSEGGKANTPWISVLRRQGFHEMPNNDGMTEVYVVDMKFPITLMQNLDTVIKEPLNHNERVEEVMEQVHQKLQLALTGLYPGNLVLSVDVGIIHHRMMELITRANEVADEDLPAGTLGRLMCVPFGKILRGVVVPHTVTKALHTEKTFQSAITGFRITEYPNYSPLKNQIRTIQSFHRPVILVDELLHKGYRIRELDPLFKEENVEIDRLVVGLLSGRGKDLMEIQKRKVESVYFLPSLRAWFVESSIYPFIGGDTVERQEKMPANLLNAINFILPYVAPRFLKDVPREQIYALSMTCLENARELLLVLEEEYQNLFGRNLTLNRLSEVIISPTCPDKGGCLRYDYHLSPSVYVENDMEKLKRLKHLL